MEVSIIYEDEAVLAVNKPSGLMVHADGRNQEKTLVDWIRENRPEIEEVGEEQILQSGEKIKRPGIVHRLDKETSGVLLIAKNHEAFSFLKEQFKDRKVEKTYRAFVYGNFLDDKLEGTIDKSIGRSGSDFRKWSAEYGARGELREAVTQYKVLKQNNDLPAGRQGFAYLEVKPKTGRTHQIRVHLKAISHPVVCDSLYAPNKGAGLGLDRLALHAASIKFTLPEGKELFLEAPLPEEFHQASELL